jgi:Arc/MetJ-type ribon-helix-helix transcriptional regulator
MSINVPQKKRGRPATGVTPRVALRLDQEMTDAIEAYRAGKQPPLNQSEAIRSILREWLASNGFLKTS